MSETFSGKGSCLCGAVKFIASKAKKSFGACHCGMCRKWTGGPSLAIDCGSDVSFEEQASLTVFDSSEWAERGFCNQCGSGIFYRLKASKQYFIGYGLFNDLDTSVVFDHQVFIDEKPGQYGFENKTKNMTGAEVFAQYAAES